MADDLEASIKWARGQAAIWRGRPAHEEPARSYMAGHYTRLADAAEAHRVASAPREPQVE